MSETKTHRTITLTGRPPVRIADAEWPLLAEASYHDYDTEHECQANRHWRGSVRVRRHADGSAIVYAVCTYETSFWNEPRYAQRAGDLLAAADATTDGIVSAIRSVHERIYIVDEAHRDMWRVLADGCIADLPAEDL